jgi:hypothetical protein
MEIILDLQLENTQNQPKIVTKMPKKWSKAVDFQKVKRVIKKKVMLWLKQIR